LVGVAPGSGVIMMPPVSVCHQVSTIGQRPPPITLVVPHPGLGIDRLADASRAGAASDRSCFDRHSSPHFMNARMAVGAV
jgi:hypothetical protein